MKIRKATLEDIPVLSELRKKQLIDEGYEANTNMDAELSAYFHRHLSDGTLVEWVAEDGGAIIATGAVAYFDFPPIFFDPASVRGYVTNMYTAPAYRRQGIARAMLDKVVEESRRRNVGLLWLGASKLGRPVYEDYGFFLDDSWLVMELGASGRLE